MIEADYNGIHSAAKQISNAANDYNSNVRELYNIVDNLESVWKGDDNVAFINTVNSYKKDILALGTVVNNYAIFLESSATGVENTQNEISNAARKLGG